MTGAPEGFVRMHSQFGAGVLDEAPFEAAAGLLYDGSRHASGFRTQLAHCNAARVVHGGAISLLADYALFAIAKGTYDAASAGGSLSTEFTSVARPGQWVEATGEVLEDTHHRVHVRGRIEADGKLCATFRGTIRKLRAKL
jgi:acyl-coenzyme A thioesterase PaaI-like protein